MYFILSNQKKSVWSEIQFTMKTTNDFPATTRNEHVDKEQLQHLSLNMKSFDTDTVDDKVSGEQYRNMRKREYDIMISEQQNKKSNVPIVRTRSTI